MSTPTPLPTIFDSSVCKLTQPPNSYFSYTDDVFIGTAIYNILYEGGVRGMVLNDHQIQIPKTALLPAFNEWCQEFPDRLKEEFWESADSENYYELWEEELDYEIAEEIREALEDTSNTNPMITIKW